MIIISQDYMIELIREDQRLRKLDNPEPIKVELGKRYLSKFGTVVGPMRERSNGIVVGYSVYNRNVLGFNEDHRPFIWRSPGQMHMPYLVYDANTGRCVSSFSSESERRAYDLLGEAIGDVVL